MNDQDLAYHAPVMIAVGKVQELTAGPTLEESEPSAGFKSSSSRQAPRVDAQDRHRFDRLERSDAI